MTTPTKAMTDETRRLIAEIDAWAESAEAFPGYTIANNAPLAKVLREAAAALRSEGREYVSVPRASLESVQARLTGLLVASCTCPTAHPDIDLHEQSCRYRNTGEALEVVDHMLTAAPPAPNRDAEDARRYRWLREHVTFHDIDADYDVEGKNVPVLAQVSNRVWYHATDDTQNNTLDTVIDAALAAAPEVTR